MEAIMYCVRNIFHLESDHPERIKEARFGTGGESIILRCGESLVEAGGLRNILSLPEITRSGTFQCTFVGNTKSADIIFKSFLKREKTWKSINNIIFEDKTDPNLALYARATALCKNDMTECIVIEDTIAGIRAIREIERDKKGRSFAVDGFSFEKGSKQFPSVMASIQDIAFFCELLAMYTAFDSWYELISYMNEKGILPPKDDSLTAKRKYLKSVLRGYTL